MKFEINDNGIVILPMTAQDEIYIETVLGLKNEGDLTGIIRKKPTTMTSWYLHIPGK